MASLDNREHRTHYIQSLYLSQLVGNGSKEEIDAIKSHCKQVKSNPVAGIIGVTKHFNISEIDQYLSTADLPKNYRIKDKSYGLNPWDKLCLATERFVSNFFYDMKNLEGKYKEPYLKIIDEIKKFGLPDCDLKTKEGQKIFTNLLEQVLASRIHLFIRNERKHLIYPLLVLFNYGIKSSCAKMFCNLVSESPQNILRYTRSQKKNAIMAMYANSCQVPNMKEVEAFFNLIDTFGKEKLHLSKSGIKALHTFLASTQNGQGTPKFNKAIQFLTGISDFMTNECPQNKPDDIISVIRSFVVISKSKGAPNLEDAIQFLKVITNFCKTELNNPKYFVDVAKIVTTMLCDKGISELEKTINNLKIINDCCKTELKNNDPKLFIALARHIATIQSGQGAPKEADTKNFLKELIGFCKNNLETEDPQDIISATNHIATMLCGKGLSASRKTINNLKVIIYLCKIELHIRNPKDLISMIKFFANINTGKGMTDLYPTKEYLRWAKGIFKEKYKINDPKEFVRILGTVSTRFTTKGLPTREETEREIDNLLEK